MGRVYEPEVLPPEPAERRAVVLAPQVVNVGIDLNQILGIGLGVLASKIFYTSKPPAKRKRKRRRVAKKKITAKGGNPTQKEKRNGSTFFTNA